jgi:hypothetical protein
MHRPDDEVVGVVTLPQGRKQKTLLSTIASVQNMWYTRYFPKAEAIVGNWLHGISNES